MATPTLTEISQALNDLLPKLKPASAVPPGTIAYFSGTTIPDGWLLCNGATVSRTTYANLFAAIGTKYGTGDGSTTFGLPNLAGRFVEGTTSTADVGTKHESGLPNITGTFTAIGAWSYDMGGPQCSGCIGLTSNANSGIRSNGSGDNWAATYAFNARSASSVYGATTVQPAAVVLLPCIKS